MQGIPHKTAVLRPRERISPETLHSWQANSISQHCRKLWEYCVAASPYLHQNKSASFAGVERECLWRGSTSGSPDLHLESTPFRALRRSIMRQLQFHASKASMHELHLRGARQVRKMKRSHPRTKFRTFFNRHATCISSNMTLLRTGLRSVVASCALAVPPTSPRQREIQFPRERDRERETEIET